MTTQSEIDYLTSIFTNYLQPIADLCESMLALQGGEPAEAQTSPPENGYAMSIIALTAFFFEGACGRARHFKDLATKRKPRRKQPTAAKTVREFNKPALAERIEEIFVVRHAIAHAHLWKAKI